MSQIVKTRKFPRALGAFGALAATAAFLVAWNRMPTADRPEYYAFADARAFWGMANFMDVATNAAFIFVGAVGWLRVRRSGQWPGKLAPFGLVLAAATFMTALGSSWFHLSPSIASIFWDRLPMAVGFSALLGLAIADRIDNRAGWWAMLALALISTGSLVAWRLGHGDLRPYYLLQYGGLVFVLGLAVAKPKGEIANVALLTALGLYIVAKVFESADRSVYEATATTISGHSVKHLVAALAVLRLYWPRLREPM